MDVSLEGAQADPKKKKCGKTAKAVAAAVKFMKQWVTAKIIVIIQTHCLEGGAFVWRGDSPATYEGCSLLEVELCSISRHAILSISLDPQRLYPA
jgi:hypothetical protein